jgi:hypothetical protein
MKNANKPISPCLMQIVGDNEYRAAKINDPVEYNVPTEGLTKREYFAAKAMVGIITNPNVTVDLALQEDHIAFSLVAQHAVNMADALLKELEV